MDRTYWETLAKAAVQGVVIGGVTFFTTLATQPSVLCLVAATGSAFFGSLTTATIFDRRALGTTQREADKAANAAAEAVIRNVADAGVI